MKLFLLLAAVPLVSSNRLRRGDCASGGDALCITPLTLDKPDALNPATIVTSVDSNGFVSAQTMNGDIPNVGPDTSYNGDTAEDVALRFTIQSPSLEPPPPPPPMITCDYDSCTTSTTAAPSR
jgi:hypothetical protein